MKIENQEFEVQVPKVDGSGVAEKVKMLVPVYWDEEIKDWIMTPDAHEIIDNTKARLIGLLLPAQLKELRERYSYSQTEMGELFQVGEKSWTRWETGKQRPSRSINLLIRALYDGAISVDYLLERAGKAPCEVEVDPETILGRFRAVFAAAQARRTYLYHRQPTVPSCLEGTGQHLRRPELGKQIKRFDFENVPLA